jgi:hypothetical protein
MPGTESFPYEQSSANLRIRTPGTSVLGRERTTERLSSQTNMAAMRIHRLKDRSHEDTADSLGAPGDHMVSRI